jgi:phage repressor protein C with HTH and peptisase S24 domain
MGTFSENIVNQRFRKVFSELDKTNKIKGKSDIAKKLDTYNHVINNILNGNRNITVEQMGKLFENYGVSANYMFGISDEMFVESVHLSSTLAARSIGEMSLSGRNNIKLVPNLARAGDALDPANRELATDFQKFSIPNLEGDLWAFKIDGDSMLPTITTGDLVVCEKLDRGEPVRDNQVYVIVTDVVVAKRVQQIRDGNQTTALRLISDNSDVYKPYDIDLAEIRHLLRVKCRLTTHAIS